MERKAYRDEIKLLLTGNILDLELDDATLDKIINSALREIQRYISSTELITTDFSKCIDFNKVKDPITGKKLKVSSVSNVYRTDGFGSENMDSITGAVDPMYASAWQLISGVGNMKNFQDYMYNYASWNTLLQIRNTTSTDFAFRFDKQGNKLYINSATNNPTKVTIEYVPRFDQPEDIQSDYWTDMLVKLSVALAKVTVGRIRSRYTQSNAIWTQDGERILQEGTDELNNLREHMMNNSMLFYPID